MRVHPQPPAASRLFNADYTRVCVANFCFWAGIYCFLGSFPLYVVRLGGATAEVGLATGAVPLTSFVTQALFARFIARRSTRLVLRAATLVLPMGALVAATASAPWVLVIAACILGIGYTTFQTAATTLASDLTPPARRGEALGVYGSFTTVSLAVGPALGIALLEGVGPWALCLGGALLGILSLSVGAGVRPGGAAHLPAQRGQDGLDAIVYYCMAVNAGLTFTHGTLIAFLPLYARSIGMDNPGLFYTVFALAAVGIRAWAGRLSDLIGRLPVLIPAAGLLAAALWGIALGPSTPVLLGLAVVYAVGYASLHPTNLAFAVDRTPAPKRALALGIVNSGFALGMGTGALVMGPVLAATDFATTFGLAGLVPLATTCAFLWRYTITRPPRLS